MEKLILGGAHRTRSPPPACASRPCTASGAACALTITVNEFTRDLWADRELEVFGEQFWRPYIHVRDAGRAVRTVLGRPRRAGQGRQSSTPGARARTTASSTSWKRSQTGRARHGLLRQTRRGPPRLQGQLRQDQGRARFRDADDRARRDRRDHQRARRRKAFGDPWDGRYNEHPVSATETFPELPLFDLQLEPQDLEAVANTLRSGWLTLGPRTAEFERTSPSISARVTRSLSTAAPRRCTSPTWPPRRSRRRGDRARVHVRCDRGRGPVLRRHNGVRGHHRARHPEPRPGGCRAQDHRPHEGCVRCPLRRLRGGRNRTPEAALRRARHSADRGCGARPQRDAGRTQARHLGTGGGVQLLLQQGAVGRRGRTALHRQRRGRGVRALAALARDDQRHLGPSQRAHRHL